MKRNLKALGLAMVAAFALSAFAASTAQAVNHHVTSPTENAIITATDEEGEAKPHFAIGEGKHKVTCAAGHYRGTVPKTATEVTLVPEYTTKCFVDETFEATVTVNHCAYILTGETDATGDAKVHVECAKKEGTEEDTSITIEYHPFGVNCTLHIGPQTPKGGVHYTQTENATSKKQDITAKLTVKEIKYTATVSSSFFCGVTAGEHTDGELTGGVTAEGYEDKGCLLSGTEKTTPKTKLDECQGAVQDLTLTTT